jgi:hypothetical protein
MKKIIVGLFIITLLPVLFLSLKTFTSNEVCGWRGLGKDWPCICLGIKSEHSTEATKVYRCTGLNLSCSELLLDNFYGEGVQKPSSCELRERVHR